MQLKVTRSSDVLHAGWARNTVTTDHSANDAITAPRMNNPEYRDTRL